MKKKLLLILCVAAVLLCAVFLFRGRVIGGDVHTADVNGFMAPLLPVG